MPNLSNPEYFVMCRQTSDGSYEPCESTAGGEGTGFSAGVNFVPAAGAYDAGDCMGDIAEFQFLDRCNKPVLAGALIQITTSIVRISETTIPAGQSSYTLHLYRSMPIAPQQNNAPWSLEWADIEAYMGSIDLGSPLDLGSAQFIRVNKVEFDARLSGVSAFGRLVTVGGFTVQAVPRNVRLHAIVR